MSRQGPLCGSFGLSHKNILVTKVSTKYAERLFSYRFLHLPYFHQKI